MTNVSTLHSPPVSQKSSIQTHPVHLRLRIHVVTIMMPSDVVAGTGTKSVVAFLLHTKYTTIPTMSSTTGTTITTMIAYMGKLLSLLLEEDDVEVVVVVRSLI